MVYDALFQAASATLQELAHRRVKATLGITSVLHTWTRELHLHPHVHAIVSAGGLTEAGWKSMSLKYLFDVKVMGTMLRGKMLTLLREAHQAGKLPATSAELAQLLLRLKRHNWGVYVKKVFRHPEHVLKYLGRHTHRVAISNSRFVAISEHAVTFRTKDGKVATLPPVRFLRCFLQQVVPKGFQKIRHYGLYASAADAQLQRARGSLQCSGSEQARLNTERLQSWRDALGHLTGRDPSVCPNCGGQLEQRPLAAEARAPPETVLVRNEIMLEPVARCVTNAVRHCFVRRLESTANLPLANATTAVICRQQLPEQNSARARHATNSDCSALRHHREAKLSPQSIREPDRAYSTIALLVSVAGGRRLQRVF